MSRRRVLAISPDLERLRRLVSVLERAGAEVDAVIDPTTLDVDDDGTVGGLDESLKDLLKAKPYLAKQTNATSYSPTNPAGGAAKPSDEAVLAEIYGVGRKSSVWGGSGGGVVWTPKTTE